MAIGVALAVALAPRPAEACTPCLPAELEAGPAAVLPSNAGIWVWSSELDYVLAFVDEVPAAIEEVPDLGLTGDGSSKLVRLVEPPPPGASVRFEIRQGATCFGEPVEPDVLELIAGPPDVTAPAPLTDLAWDIHRYFLPDRFGCALTLYGTLYLRAELPPEEPGAAVRMLEIELSNGVDPHSTHRRLVSAGLATVALDLPLWVVGNPPTGEMCVRATPIDAAGLRGEPSAWVCAPCHSRDAGEVASHPDEPRWGPDDEYPGGYCLGEPPEPDPPEPEPDPPEPDPPADSSGGEPPEPPSSTSDEATSSSTATDSAGADGEVFEPRGCACRAPRSDATPGWLLPLLVLAAGSRRRRRP